MTRTNNEIGFSLAMQEITFILFSLELFLCICLKRANSIQGFALEMRETHRTTRSHQLRATNYFVGIFFFFVFVAQENGTSNKF